MNNNNLEKFIENIESIKMTQYEKNEMRQHLSSFAMNYSSAPKSPYYSSLLLTKKIMATVFIAIISIGSFSQFASSDALPGDTLYPVKIAHERIRLATTAGETRKINFEIQQTEKRIQEATQLAQKEKLNPETEQEIAAVIRELTTRVKNHIEEVKQEDPESALILNSELKSTIRANSEILRQVTQQKTRDRSEEEQEEKSKEVDEISSRSTENIIEKDVEEIEINEVTSISIETEQKEVKEVIEISSKINQDNIEKDIEEIEISFDIVENDTREEEIEQISSNIVENNLDIPLINNISSEKINSSITEKNKETNQTQVPTMRSLLESLDEEVEEIEALEIAVENEIIKDEIFEDNEVFKAEIKNEISEKVEITSTSIINNDDLVNGTEVEITSQDEKIEDLIEEEQSNSSPILIQIDEDLMKKNNLLEVKEIKEFLTNEIKSLQDIIKIKEEILEIKSIAGPNGHNPEEYLIIFNEKAIEEKAEKFIQEKKYKQAFIQLQSILEYYQEEKIELQAERKLGIGKQSSLSGVKSEEIERIIDSNI